MNPRLRVIAGPLKDKVIDLAAGEISIGRVAANQIAISDPALSRRHCSIAPDGEGFRIQDLQSRNATRIGAVAIVRARLDAGATLKLGDTIVRFEPSQQSHPQKHAEQFRSSRWTMASA